MRVAITMKIPGNYIKSFRGSSERWTKMAEGDGPIFLELDGMAEFAEDGIVSKTLVKKTGFEVGMFCMASGQELSEHTTVFHAVVHVIRGKGIFKIDDVEHPAVPGAWFYIPPNQVHAIRVDDDMVFLLTVFRGN
jgi:quercetin dioxygenase-like cupin family protein